MRGSAAANLKDLQGALEAIAEGLTAQPEHSDLHASLGVLQAAQGHSVEAEASFKQAVAVAPQAIAPRLVLANYYWSSGRIADAEHAFNEALKIQPTDGAANTALARFYIATRRVAEAEAPLAVRRRPQPSRNPSCSWPIITSAEAAIGRLADPRGAGQDPRAFAAATARQAGIVYGLGKHDEAYSLLGDILAKQPKNAQVLVVKGKWQIKENDLAAAYDTAQAAVKADPEAWAAHDLLGMIEALRNQPADATKAYMEALRLNPRALGVQIALADLHLKEGKTDAAVRFALDAVQTQPTSGRARFTLAQAYLNAGELDRARAQLDPLVAGDKILGRPGITRTSRVAVG